MGGTLATESSEAARKIVNSVPAPPGIKAYVTGAGPLIADQSHAGEKGVAKVTLITLLVILVMLLLVYRSVSTVLIMLFMVFVELLAARGVVATLDRRRNGLRDLRGRPLPRGPWYGRDA
jgi:RND superfamily putative drug exporter